MIGKRQYQILCAVLMGAQTELEIFTEMCINEVNDKGLYQEEAQKYIATRNCSSRRKDSHVHKWYNIFNRSLNNMIEQELLEKDGLHGVRIVVGQRDKCRELVIEYMGGKKLQPKEVVQDGKIYCHDL